MHLPQPVYAANTPLEELGAAELLLVASARLASLPYRDPTGSHRRLAAGLRSRRHRRNGIPAFDALFQIMAATARRSLDVRCLRCAYLGEDEAWLLQLVGLLQRGDTGNAAAILADWLPPAAARIALAPARDLALVMAEGDLRVPHRHAEAAIVHRLGPGGSCFTRPGSRSLAATSGQEVAARLRPSGVSCRPVTEQA